MGKHSMNLWLIHSFFIFYYLRQITFLTRNPLVMFFTVTALSLLCSMVIGKAHEKLSKKGRQTP